MNAGELKKLGAICADFRRYLGMTQEEVAGDLKCTAKGVSHFENGRSTNIKFFFWYVEHGLLDWYFGRNNG